MKSHTPASLASVMGIAGKNNREIGDIADGMGNACEGRIAQQKFAAARQSHGVHANARAVGMEYTR